MQYGGALPRHLSEHKEMLPQASFQEHKTGVKSKGTVTNTDCYPTCSPFRRFCNCCPHCNESILVTTRCTGGEGHYPLLPRAGGTRIAVAGKGPGREQQQWDVLGLCSRGHGLLPWRHSTPVRGPHCPTVSAPLWQRKGHDI